MYRGSRCELKDCVGKTPWKTFESTEHCLRYPVVFVLGFQQNNSYIQCK